MAWTSSTKNGHQILTETDLTITDNAGGDTEYVTVSAIIDSGKYPGWQNAKFPVQVTVTTVNGSGAGVLDVFWQVSNDSATTGDVIGTGSSLTPLWADLAISDLGATAVTNATASHTGTVDATDVYAPFARVSLKVAGTTDITDSAGRCTISLSMPGGKATEIGSIGGVGADPS
jgi:hypothetical protein